MIENITEATPVEIDTEIARLYQVRMTYQVRAEREWASMVHALRSLLMKRWNEKVTSEEIRNFLAEHAEISESHELKISAYESYTMKREAEQAWDHYGKYIDATTDADEVFEEIKVLDEEWERRGRWNRAFLVTNNGGHVHSSMHCSTCRDTTQFHWVTEYSDHEESEIVEAAGERACTVCYPSAPVEVLSKPTLIFSDEEKAAQKARDERAAKKADRERAMITLNLWDNRYTRSGKVLDRYDITYKTTRALQNDAGALVRELEGAYASINGFDLDVRERRAYDGSVFGGEHNAQARWNLQYMLEALAERGVDTQALVEKNTKRAAKER